MTELLPHDMNVFVLLYDGHTIKSVSDTLDMPVPTVRKSINKLRAVVGGNDKLFIPRPDSTYTPTPLATSLEPEFRACSRQFSAIFGRLEELKRSFSKGGRHFTLALPALCHAHSSDIITTLQRSYPDATIAITVFTPIERQAILDRLFHRTLDLAIDYDQTAYSSYRSQALISSEMRFVSSPEMGNADASTIIRECTYLRTGITPADDKFDRYTSGLTSPSDMHQAIFKGDFYTILPNYLCSGWSKKSPHNQYVRVGPSPVELPEFNLRSFFPAGDTPKLSALKAAIAKTIRG